MRTSHVSLPLFVLIPREWFLPHSCAMSSLWNKRQMSVRQFNITTMEEFLIVQVIKEMFDENLYQPKLLVYLGECCSQA